VSEKVLFYFLSIYTVMIDFSRTLFVCTGNVYRSFIAERVFIGIQGGSQGSQFFAWSRGTGIHYPHPHQYIIDFCTQLTHYNFENHTPTLISSDDTDKATVIICFATEHINYLKTHFPKSSLKAFLFHDIFQVQINSTLDVLYESVSSENTNIQYNILDIVNSIEQKFLPNRLSVLIPVYNEQKNISSLLDYLSQSLSIEDEVIVISSGSTDSTDLIVTGKVLKTKNIHLVVQNCREGKLSALKLGLKSALNKTIVLIDGDIRLSRNFVEQVRLLDIAHCYTGRVLSLNEPNDLLNTISYLSTESWHHLRIKSAKSAKFLYPSGYCMVLPFRRLQYALFCLKSPVVNDDAHIALELSKKATYFNYEPDLMVYVRFPQTWADFFKQKIRTRLGRQENNDIEFKLTEAKWRKELIRFMKTKYIIPATFLLILDYFCRIFAKFFLITRKNHHLWPVIKSSK
jgi:glycosyltransferase involved in cell wall biosynthesis/protein-tyrosine-phosphatase